MEIFKKQLTFNMTFMLVVIFSLLSTGVVLAQPANDDCGDAIAINCGDVVTGSNTGASTDGSTCNTNPSQHGVWYSIVGNGGELTLSTCHDGTDFDTQIAVFSGSCGSLICEAGNNNGNNCNNGRLSTVSFQTTGGTTYYVLVTGTVGANGTFVLSADCGASPIENDVCDDALEAACGDVISGATTGASNEPGLPFCGTGLTAGPGVWYHMVGTGEEVTVTTCSANTNYDTKLGVFVGPCGDLVCEGGDDDEFSCGHSSLHSQVVFISVPGEDYYIYVTGFSTNSGDFDLTITCDNINVPDNDDCANAEAINCGDTVSGTTDDATSESLDFCGTSLSSAPGVWYSIEGTGGEMTASLCGSSYDTKIGVFDGSCGALSCIAGNDDSCGLQSEVSFDTDEGSTYYIYVTGFSSNSGDFDLAITCEDTTPPVPTCDAAEAVDCGSAVSGDTGNGAVNDLSCDGVNLSTAPGVWYVIDGSDLLVTVDVDGHSYDAQVGVFSGSCDNLTCVAANNNAVPTTRDASVSFAAYAGETYYIYVSGLSGSNGAYDMSVSCAILNDSCADAELIGCDDTVTGSTENATPNSDTPYCGGSFASPRTAWYAIMGDDSEMTLSLCGSSYDTKIGVFDGSCGALSCVAGNDDDCGLQSEVTFQSVAGVTYYIAVSGWSTFSYGDYELAVTCVGDEPPSGNGDTCGEAINLPVGAEGVCSNVTASNDGATDSGEGTPTCASYNGGDIWFALTVPASGNVTVETSSAGGFTDSGMAAYSGSCGSLAQIECNDDGGTGLFSKLELEGLASGSTVYVRVWEYFNDVVGDFNICAYEPIVVGPVTNDDCASATALTVGAAGVCNNVTATNDGATDSGIADPGCASYNGGDLWFSLLVPGSGNVTIETSSAGGFTDSGMAVYNGSCGSLNLIECNDDGGAGLYSLISLTGQVAGTTIWVRVWEYGNNSFGNFNVCAYEPAVTLSAPNSNNPFAETEVNLVNKTISTGNIYPNPTASGQIANIDIRVEEDSNADITVFDNTGRMVKNMQTELFGGKNQVAIQTNGLAAGTYFVSLRIGDQNIHKRMVIVR